MKRVVAGVALLAVTACGDAKDKSVAALSDTPHTSAAGGPWQVLYDPKLGLMKLEPDGSGLIFQCVSTSVSVAVTGFEPAQAWPQPELTVAFGDEEFTAVPDARNIGDQVSLEVSHKATFGFLNGMDQAERVDVRFHGQEKSFDLDERAASDFLNRCRSSLPPEMRAGM